MKKIYLVLFVFLCGLGSNAQTHENKLHQPTRHHTRIYHPGKNHTNDRLHSHRPRTYHSATRHRRVIYRSNRRPHSKNGVNLNIRFNKNGNRGYHYGQRRTMHRGHSKQNSHR